MLYLSCLQTNTRPVKGPALPEQFVSPPDNPVCSVPFKLQELPEFDATIGYIELGVPPGPPPHKIYYAIPFDITDRLRKASSRNREPRCSRYFFRSI